MLPTGTANDQGKSFGLDATEDALPRNVEIIVLGRETRLDGGVLEQGESPGAMSQRDRFFDSAGFGLSARILAQRNRDRDFVETLGPVKELYRDQAVYAGAFVKTFFESYIENDKFAVMADLDGVPMSFSGLSDLIVNATRLYAGFWVFDPTSLHDDGAFELVPFRGKRDSSTSTGAPQLECPRIRGHLHYAAFRADCNFARSSTFGATVEIKAARRPNPRRVVQENIRVRRADVPAPQNLCPWAMGRAPSGGTTGSCRGQEELQSPSRMRR